MKGSSIEEINTTDYLMTWENTYTNGNKGFPYDDTYYSRDANALKNNNMLHSSGYVWLASRRMGANSVYSGFNVSYVDSDGNVSNNQLFREYSDGSADSNSRKYGVRPVVSLASVLKIEGEGTEGNPWKIN